MTERLGDNQTASFISRTAPVAPTDLPLPPNTIFSGCDLYLGTFDKDDVQKIVDRLGGETEFEVLDRLEREDDAWTEADGSVMANTCFARIKLGTSGEPLLQSLEVSTLPWAIGHALNGNLTDLTFHAFENGKLRLAEQFFNFEMSRRAEYGVKNADEPVPLRANDLEPLLNVFCAWANYWPSDKLPLALARIRYKEIKATELEDAEQTDCGDDIARVDDNDGNFDRPKDDLSADDEADDGGLPEIGILNSFYLTDLELAMEQAAAGNLPNTLRDYLSPQADEDRVHIDTEAGRTQIVEMLQPDRVNIGRWPTDPQHTMSLMQQFSINAAFSRLQDGGVFSVNGPPGTGKTTLLRDVIAENMVRRAHVLAGFKRAEQAFVSRTRIVIGDESFNVGNLHPALTGYEMVVASSNNTAVENISKDLPKAGSIFPSNGEAFRYLQPVAHKLAAEWVDKSGRPRFRALDDQEMPWGLIACALGKSKNRKAFRERVLGRNLSDDVRPTWSGRERPRTLWQWRSLQDETDARKAFSAAQSDFKAIEQQVLGRQKELQLFADLHQETLNNRLESRIIEIERQTHSAKSGLDIVVQSSSETRASLEEKEKELSELKELEGQIDRLRPSFLAVLFQRGRKRKYEVLTRENADAQINVRKEIAGLKHFLSAELNPKQSDAERTLASLDKELASAKSELETRDLRMSEFRRVFPGAVLLETTADIDTPDLQRRGLWHDETFNRLRSDLFKATMKLHESWLTAIMQPKGLQYYQTMRALAALLDGKQPEDDGHCQVLWQNFFMVVPVVSTTFASFSRQFNGLGEGAIGWVLIDEAGQAVPQAAVGAMLRAKRALVIGDPLQIEPVLTLAQPLIRALCDLSDHTRDGFYSPAKTSVQVLSDAANIFGETLESDAKDMWVGSPLRVHRRCLDPMFSVANAIAYNGKMVHSRTEPHPEEEQLPIPLQSSWIDLGGKVSGKQVVPEQIRFASAMVIDCYKRTGILPNLYVISPFKEIKAALNRVLGNKETWARHGSIKPAKLSDWLDAHVGTVHTFQGKEEDTVVMVLGTDADHAGAARWAASRPNILNVAITRSKRRFYMIGDKRLWGELRYFKEAAAMLPTLLPSSFMDGN
ncbi:DEAD/DEAH box helicase [Brucella pituitosa]